jgi:hypothetical protein
MDLLASPVSLTFRYRRYYRLTQMQRPQIMVSFRNLDPQTGEAIGVPTRVNAVVDSGCDVTLIPGRYADTLGIRDITKLDEHQIKGISGRVKCYGQVMLLAHLCDEWIRVPVYFFSSTDRVGLLGREGAFDALQLAFVNEHRTLYAAALNRKG